MCVCVCVCVRACVRACVQLNALFPWGHFCLPFLSTLFSRFLSTVDAHVVPGIIHTKLTAFLFCKFFTVFSSLLERF